MRIGVLCALLVSLPLIAFAAPININTANTTLLDTLPGIGPTKAAAIIDYRTKHGPFATTKDIQKVSGIGPATFTKLEPLITVDGVESPPGSQPSPAPVSYTKGQAALPPVVKRVEPVTSETKNIQPYDEAVTAPTAVTNIAAVGATVPARPPTTLFHSPWFYAMVGVVVVASGIFILL